MSPVFSSDGSVVLTTISSLPRTFFRSSAISLKRRTEKSGKTLNRWVWTFWACVFEALVLRLLYYSHVAECICCCVSLRPYIVWWAFSELIAITSADALGNCLVKEVPVSTGWAVSNQTFSAKRRHPCCADWWKDICNIHYMHLVAAALAAYVQPSCFPSAVSIVSSPSLRDSVKAAWGSWILLSWMFFRNSNKNLQLHYYCFGSNWVS